MINLQKCPWEIKRVSVSHEEMVTVINYLTSLNVRFDSILEIGCGSSSWYLSQLGYSKYVAVEELNPVIDLTKKYITNIEIVKKWEDIPRQQYQHIFIDSHVGGGAKGDERHKSLLYIMENELAMDNAILIAHDVWGDQISIDPNTIHIPKNWKETLRKYGWNTIKSIKNGKCFGIYQRITKLRR